MNTSIQMPPRIAALRREGGYPVPFFVAIPESGPVDFRVASPIAKIQCYRSRLCWICGTAMGRVGVFIGGPQSCALGTFGDGPSHRDCAEYALKVCPYLAVTARDRRDEPAALAAVNGREIMIALGSTRRTSGNCATLAPRSTLI